MMKRLLLPLLAAATLAACASAPSYIPAATASGPGYSDTQIENNRFFVTYRAPGLAEARLVSDYALLRAAEITLEHNRDWFWVDRRTTDTSGGGGYGQPSVGVSVGGGSFGRHSGVGVGVGMNFPLGGGGERASAATLEVRLGEGAKPDDANAYDAHSLQAALRARLISH